jgi:hypothetical protein
MGKGYYCAKNGHGSSFYSGNQTTLDSNLTSESNSTDNSYNNRFQYNIEKVQKVMGITIESSQKLKILFGHDNGKGYYTTIAHKLADLVGHHPQIENIVDYKVWGQNEKTSSIEINRREINMVQQSDVVVRFIQPSSKSDGRKLGAIREINKAINAGKPILEIYLSGAHDSPFRSLREKNYTNRVEVHLKEKQVLLKGFLEGMKILQEKGLLPYKIKFV